MSRISPKVDIAFKKIFGVEENKDLLISLINSIVSKADQVADITLLNPYNPQNFHNDKLSVLDIKAQGLDGKRFNIEIQLADEADYDKRALYYWAKLYTEQLKKADDYSKLNKAIGIHILNFTSILGTDEYHNIFQIKEKNKDISYFQDLELHTIELKKFNSDNDEKLSDLVKKIKSSLDMWMAFLTRNDLLKPNELPKEISTDELNKALTVLDVMNLTEKERDLYEGQLKWLRIETNTLKKAEDKGMKKGLKKGILKGIEKGIEKGKIAIAKNMLQEKSDINFIQKVTDLSIEEINKLK